VSLVIGGMTCGACAARVERRLNDLEGVQASVNYASERARVVMPAGTPVRRLIDEIESIGFSAATDDENLTSFSSANEADLRVRTLGRRLVVAAVLFMPLCDLSLVFFLIPSLRFTGWQWVLIAVAAPVPTWAAWPFYRAAIRGVRHRTFTMDTLVSLGIVAATSWSVYAMFWEHASAVQHSILFLFSHQAGGDIYLDVAAGVTMFLLAGRYFEAWSKRRTGNALESLAAVAAKDVAIVDETGRESRRPVSELSIGDRFVVRPGEAVATDGTVVSGHSAIDRSAMTGESLPVDVEPGDRVVGGTVSAGGRLLVEATKVGRDTQLSQMMRLVEDAQNEKAAVQRLADRISGTFVPCVLAIALVTLVAWLATGAPAERACSAALSVLIIACPCALGLATPTALLVASGEGARLGIFFKGYQGLEASRQIDTVVLDKTGTVTGGQMTVTEVVAVAGLEGVDVLRWAAAVEQASEHLVARAVTDAGRQQLSLLPPVERFLAVPGLGARGIVEGDEISVGRADFLEEAAAGMPARIAAACAEWETGGRTAVLVARNGSVVGAIAVADEVRPSAAPAVAQLKALGLTCLLLTGDNETTARAVARSIGVTDVVAGALPADKVALIRRLQGEGRSVAMVGDGVNDGPALASADLGLAIGTGTDVAINAADLIVVRDDLRVVATAISLARRTLRTIRGNLAWAFAYNVAAIPVAACGLLNPLIAAAAMALSSSFVVWNSARLRHFSTRSEGLRGEHGPLEDETPGAHEPSPRRTRERGAPLPAGARARS